ncbi:MAG: PAS domain S-box protein, partial [bacterium]|nr:PAS domain S-box protein [bacterium]
QKSNSLLHSIIESPDNIIMFALDKNYNYLSYNKAHANEMKYIYDADIEIGQNIMQYIPTEEDRRKVVENYKRVLKGERFTEIQQYGLDEDRSWYELIFNPIMSDSGNITGFTVFVTNITERKQAEKALLSEKMLAEGYINSLPGLFYVFDEQGLIARWNKEMERVTGYSSGEIGTMHGTDFFEGEDKQLIGERMLEVFTKGSSESEAELVTKDGRRIPYYFTGLRREFNGKPHLVGLGIDITERKKVEDELKKYREKLEALIMARTEELEKQNKKLENAMKVFIDREMKIINLEKRIRDYDKT